MNKEINSVQCFFDFLDCDTLRDEICFNIEANNFVMQIVKYEYRDRYIYIYTT